MSGGYDLSDAALVDRLTSALPTEALLISSDLVRAVATADVLAGGSAGCMRLRLPNAVALREFNFGAWDGLHSTEISKRDPKRWRAYFDQPGDVAPPGGESWNQLSARVAECVGALSAAHLDSHIIAVAHVGVIMTQLQHALGITPYQALRLKVPNLSVTELQVDRGEWSVRRVNHIP